MVLKGFEVKSKRVKGLSFHPTRPWILSSLHSGEIQLWDYRVSILIQTFKEHEGPVRSVCFHPGGEPLFVSGGDDCKVKLWDYNKGVCTFTWLGHSDYVRTTFFHNELPWIISASDDQTIRVWNFQSRQCICVLPGHNHYVMCAQFHPTRDLVASGSLDTTARIWDISHLRKQSSSVLATQLKRLAPQDLVNSFKLYSIMLDGHRRGVNWVSWHPTKDLLITGSDDNEMKIWEFNRYSFSARVRITLYCHRNNVSSVMFHPLHPDLVISNSEDKRMCFTVQSDSSSRYFTHHFRGSHYNRWWIVTAHPNKNLIAGGHDSGLVVLRTARERPAFVISEKKKCVYYFLNQAIYRFALNKKDEKVMSVKKKFDAPDIGSMVHGYRHLPATVMQIDESRGDLFPHMLSYVKGKREIHNLVVMDKDTTHTLTGNYAALLSRTRVAEIKDETLKIYEIEKKRIKELHSYKVPSGVRRVHRHASPSTVILIADDMLRLFDLQTQEVVASLPVTGVRRLVWNRSNTVLAVMSRLSVSLTDANLKRTPAALVKESIPVKGGVFVPGMTAFIYATHSHFKYLTLSGDSGIVRSVEEVVYPVMFLKAPARLLYIRRNMKTATVEVDLTDIAFRDALEKKNYASAVPLLQKIVKERREVGNMMTKFLQSKEHPELALKLARNDEDRFRLAVEAGQLEPALKAARALGSNKTWLKLAEVATMYGKFSVAETACNRPNGMDALSFLHLITGQFAKMEEQLVGRETRARKDAGSGGEIDPVTADEQMRMSNYLGDPTRAARALAASGQVALAYVTALTYGLEAEAGKLREHLPAGFRMPPLLAKRYGGQPPPQEDDAEAAAAAGAAAAVAYPPRLAPVVPQRDAASDLDWPELSVAGDFLDVEFEAHDADAAAAAGGGAEGGGARGAAGEAEEDDGLDLDVPDLEIESGDEADGARGRDGDLGSDGGIPDVDIGGLEDDDIPDIDLPSDLEDDEDAGAAEDGGRRKPFAAPQAGVRAQARWILNPGELACAGEFEEMAQVLGTQAAVRDVRALEPALKTAFLGSECVLPSAFGCGEVMLPICTARNQTATNTNTATDESGNEALYTGSTEYVPDNAPAVPFSADRCASEVAALRKRMPGDTSAFKASGEVLLADFEALIGRIVLAPAEGHTEAARSLGKSLQACADYILALRIHRGIAEAKQESSAVRELELTAYLTHVAVEMAHKKAALLLAMKVCEGMGNFATAKGFVERLLSVVRDESGRKKLAKHLFYCDKKGSNKYELEYKPKIPFSICAEKLVPIYTGVQCARCYLCGSLYAMEESGSVCGVCRMAEIGRASEGLAWQAKR